MQAFLPERNHFLTQKTHCILKVYILAFTFLCTLTLSSDGSIMKTTNHTKALSPHELLEEMGGIYLESDQLPQR